MEKPDGVGWTREVGHIIGTDVCDGHSKFDVRYSELTAIGFRDSVRIEVTVEMSRKSGSVVGTESRLGSPDFG